MLGDYYAELLSIAWREAEKAVGSVEEDPTARFAQYRGGGEGMNAFAREVCGYSRWAFQRSIGEHLFSDQRVSVRSCRSPGKTKELAFCVEYFFNCYPSVIVTLAPTERQVKDLLWAEIRKLHASARVPLLGKPDLTQIRLGPKHYAIGFSTDRPERVQGFHSSRQPPPDDPDRDLTLEELQQRALAAVQHAGTLASEGHLLLFVLDECPGIQQQIIEVILGSIIGPNAFILMAGNPLMDLNAAHEFARSHHPGSGYYRIKCAYEPEPEWSPDPLDADETYDHLPNWLMPPESIEARKLEWEEDSPLWLAHGLAQFAGEADELQVVTAGMLASADERRPRNDEGPHVGVDVARSRDFCVASLWFNGTKVGEESWRPRADDEEAMMTVAQKILDLSRSWGRALKPFGWDGSPIPGRRVHVDKPGLGEGVCDRLAQLGLRVDKVDGGAAPKGDWKELTGEMVFRNRRAELHWIYRRALQEGIARLPKRFKESWQQAQWPRYKYVTYKGETAIQIEEKEKMRERYAGKSPDFLDSDLLAWSRAGVRTRPRFRRVKGLQSLGRRRRVGA